MQDPSPAAAGCKADDPLAICAAVLIAGAEPDETGLVEIEMLKLGRIEQDRRCGRPLSAEERAAWDWLAANGGGVVIATASRLYCEHLAAHTRENGGTIITETSCWQDGRRTVTRTIERFPAPVVMPRTRPMQRRRGAGRPRAQATRSSAASGDSGDSDPHEPPAAPVRPAKRAVVVPGAAERVVAGWLAVGAMLFEREERRR